MSAVTQMKNHLPVLLVEDAFQGVICYCGINKNCTILPEYQVPAAERVAL